MSEDNSLKDAQADAGVVEGAAADKIDEHTPDPKTPPVVDKAPEPPTPQGDGLDELKAVVAGLATSVASLTDLVTKQTRDESPNSVPWTHKGSRRD